MKKLFAYNIGCLIVSAVLLAFALSGCAEKQNSKADLSVSQHAEEALKFAKRKGLNTNYAIFVDYSIPSGTPRLFVWDFKAQKIVARTYVMHGCGKGSTKEKPVFSNEINSECSSLGKFKVFKDRHGAKITRSFRMEGYDKSNSNAWKRGLMIHQSKWIDYWKWRKYIPLHRESCQGCITVGSKGMDYLESLIKREYKPLLLWSYSSK